MPRRDLSDEQIKADILNRLINSGAFGRHHIPVDQMRSWIQNKIKRNGKTVSRCIDELNRSRLIYKTSRDTIYADHSKLNEIFDYIDKHLK